MLNIAPYSHTSAFWSLCIEHGVNIPALARESGRHALVIWDMILGNRVTLLDAHMVLSSFNTIHGTNYHLEDLNVALDENTGIQPAYQVTGIPKKRSDWLHRF